MIEGYTDAKGSDSHNLPLSQKRTDSVKDWLVTKGGINGEKLSTKGWGKAKPVAPNTNPDGSDNPEGRQKNRRVEVTVKKQGFAVSAETVPPVMKPAKAAEPPHEQRQAKGAIPEKREVPLGWYRVMVATPVRSEPRTNAEILTQLQRQTRVRVVRTVGDYLEVRSAKKDRPPGYVLRKDVLFVGGEEQDTE
ncbi:MAG: OmpA family protein [Deltaproteobacteria bacterium]|nr:OmpA family protein [Deltaproteobacteria bacterium]